MKLVGWQIYLYWLSAASIIIFIFYGYDKIQAKRSGWRIPEKYLHVLAFVGGFAGGWLGRSLFRHKTRKGIFLFVLVISTIIHLGLASWLYLK